MEYFQAVWYDSIAVLPGVGNLPKSYRVRRDLWVAAGVFYDFCQISKKFPLLS